MYTLTLVHDSFLIGTLYDAIDAGCTYGPHPKKPGEIYLLRLPAGTKKRRHIEIRGDIYEGVAHRYLESHYYFIDRKKGVCHLFDYVARAISLDGAPDSTFSSSLTMHTQPIKRVR